MTPTGRDRIRELIISGLGSGFYPFASGSWGSLYATALFAAAWALVQIASGPRWAVEAVTAAGILAACGWSVRWGAWAIARYGRSDPKQFTLDEFAGQWVALLALPAALDGGLWRLAVLLAGQFFLFRVFDVLKPPPARQLESLPAGWGVLCDDLMAGFYANLVGQVLWRFTPMLTWLGAA